MLSTANRKTVTCVEAACAEKPIRQQVQQLQQQGATEQEQKPSINEAGIFL